MKIDRENLINLLVGFGTFPCWHGRGHQIGALGGILGITLDQFPEDPIVFERTLKAVLQGKSLDELYSYYQHLITFILSERGIPFSFNELVHILSQYDTDLITNTTLKSSYQYLNQAGNILNSQDQFLNKTIQGCKNNIIFLDRSDSQEEKELLLHNNLQQHVYAIQWSKIHKIDNEVFFLNKMKESGKVLYQFSKDIGIPIAAPVAVHLIIKTFCS